MRVCDKCGSVAYAQVAESKNQQVFDLCEIHYIEMVQWISCEDKPKEEPAISTPPKPRRGRPPGTTIGK